MTKPWPRSKTANIGVIAGARIIDGKPKTSSSTISKICNMMDKIETKKKASKGDYELPRLPPKGMRFGPPKPLGSHGEPQKAPINTRIASNRRTGKGSQKKHIEG